MANKYSDVLLSAIDVIASKRVAEAKYDKTVVAEIIAGPNNGKYTLRYENTFIEAFSHEQLIPHSMVYVLIPQGDMGEEKQIVGVVNFYAPQETAEEIVLWEETKGMIIKNKMLIGYVDSNNQHIYFEKKED